MYLKCLQKPCCLGWFKTSQALRSAVRLNSSKDNFIAKSFRLPTERKLSILLNFLFPFVSYRRIFNLEMQNFSLENHHMNACQPFCWWITFTKVSNPFLPSPPKWLTWPLDDCGGVGYGWFYWFSLYWRRFFSQTSLELEIFSPTYNGVRFIFQHCTSCTQSSSVHAEERDKELWGTLEQDCLWLVSAKNNKNVSDWSIQNCTRAVERAACLVCERGFPQKCWTKYFIQAIPKQHLLDHLGRTTVWIFQFSNKIPMLHIENWTRKRFQYKKI